ncbi:tyrosine-type recombinase/integrase [Bradyrhizobium sp. Tv2a-2]|uniref:tyrosine-type recombinase/integrase n=1 Tax=Bradyrhizobium sp. Tv2a-2 TaxID=113395 RepID=UPI0003F6A174|nr:tyrosine-type recombinase/integrase [Bradyrhizobium sp. Tv2a-2]
MFPAVPEAGEHVDLAKPPNPRNFSKEFARRAGLIKLDERDFGNVRFHDLRCGHATALLDAGIPIHTVAHRIGDDPAILLRNYVKRKRSMQADQSLTTALGNLASTFLK